MSDEKLVNIASLLTTCNFEIEQLPDDLKCAQCKLVLEDASQVPCGCTYCRACIDDMIARGVQFCPGGSEDCGESPLSSHQSDYFTNQKVFRLTVKCPHNGCMLECRLTNIEEHLRKCARKGEECPFRELGCTQDKLAVEEIGGHLQHDNRRHIEILIEMIANMNKEIETLKRRDDVRSREIETLKHDLVLKNDQIKSIMDQIKVQTEIQSIKEEKEDLAGLVRILTEKIEREIDERHKNDELDFSIMCEHMDREIATVTRLIISNKKKLAKKINSVRDNIRLLIRDANSINDDVCAMKSQVESIQALVELGQVDARFDWLINGDVGKEIWTIRESENFAGKVHPYKYRLASWNDRIGTPHAVLYIRLHIYAGPNDGQLEWPFEARVVITVTDRDRREACRSISLQCRIERPPDADFNWSHEFVFCHSELKESGLSLSPGVRVSCVIVPGPGQ